MPAGLLPLLIPLAALVTTYLVDKFAPKLIGHVPSELLPLVAVVTGVAAEQAAHYAGAPCTSDPATCAAVAALLGLAGTGLHQVKKQLVDLVQVGPSTSFLHD